MAKRIAPKQSRHLLYGFPWKPETDVQSTWRKYGWRPQAEQAGPETKMLALPNPNAPGSTGERNRPGIGF